MPHAWACIAFPEQHGPFLQSGLDALAASHPELQRPRRYCCPQCIVADETGLVRAATASEGARLAPYTGE